MKKHRILGIVASILVCSVIATELVPEEETLDIVKDDNVKNIITIGKNLTIEQKDLMLSYFNVKESDVDIIYVSNKDERVYLEGIASEKQIGKKTFSCAYIEPTKEGGIHVKTVNLNWVDSEMIKNALITSGITNCNVVCAAPKESSGTGSLAGIFKAYNSLNIDELDEEKLELASKELVQTMDLAKDIGKEESASLIGDIKQEVLLKGVEDKSEVLSIVGDYISENKLNLSEEQQDSLIQLMLDISKKDYSVEDVRNAYKTTKQTIDELKEAKEKTVGILLKIGRWLKSIKYKITGKYESMQNEKEQTEIKNKLGIIATTNDELLGDGIIITMTDYYETSDEEENTDEEQEDSTEEQEGIFQKIGNFFKSMFNPSDSDTENTEETESKVIASFEKDSENNTQQEETQSIDDNTEVIAESNTETEENNIETEENVSTEVADNTTEQQYEDAEGTVLKYVTFEFQNKDYEYKNNTSNNGVVSLEDLTN